MLEDILHRIIWATEKEGNYLRREEAPFFLIGKGRGSHRDRRKRK